MVIAANVLLAIAAVAHVHAAVAATLVSYQVIRKRRRKGKQQRRSAAWSLMHEQLRAPTDEDEDPYAYMNDWAFRRYHRLSREAFDHLLELISSDLEPVSRRGARGHLASPIGARTQLSVALRILAGGSYLDVSHSHRVSRPMCFTIVDRVVDAINSCEELDLPLVPALDACEAGDSSMLGDDGLQLQLDFGAPQQFRQDVVLCQFVAHGATALVDDVRVPISWTAYSCTRDFEK